jgi:hypothetical protein
LNSPSYLAIAPSFPIWEVCTKPGMVHPELAKRFARHVTKINSDSQIAVVSDAAHTLGRDEQGSPATRCRMRSRRCQTNTAPIWQRSASRLETPPLLSGKRTSPAETLCQVP